MTLAVLPLQRETIPSSAMVRRKQSVIPEYLRSRRPAFNISSWFWMRSLIRSMGAAAVLETAAEIPPTADTLVHCSGSRTDLKRSGMHWSCLGIGHVLMKSTTKPCDEAMLARFAQRKPHQHQQSHRQLSRRVVNPSQASSIDLTMVGSRQNLGLRRLTGTPMKDFSFWLTSPTDILADMKQKTS